MKKEHASVVLVFGGFVVLVLVFRGVWGNTWHALIGSKGAGTSSGASSSSAQAAALTRRPVQLTPGSFALEYPTPASGALPGSAPTPASSSLAHLDRQGLGGYLDPNDFSRGHNVAGYSFAQIVAIAKGQAPAYNGARYVPHNLATEGEIFTDARGRYINVKFIDPRAIPNRNTSTEKVYLPK